MTCSYMSGQVYKEKIIQEYNSFFGPVIGDIWTLCQQSEMFSRHNRFLYTTPSYIIVIIIIIMQRRDGNVQVHRRGRQGD